MARDYFGDTVDYAKVKVFHRRYFPLQPENTVMSPNGNIYYARDNRDYVADFSGAGPGGESATHARRYRRVAVPAGA